jgi:hypothetical protein
MTLFLPTSLILHWGGGGLALFIDIFNMDEPCPRQTKDVNSSHVMLSLTCLKIETPKDWKRVFLQPSRKELNIGTMGGWTKYCNSGQPQVLPKHLVGCGTGSGYCK